MIGSKIKLAVHLFLALAKSKNRMGEMGDWISATVGLAQQLPNSSHLIESLKQFPESDHSRR